MMKTIVSWFMEYGEKDLLFLECIVRGDDTKCLFLDFGHSSNILRLYEEGHHVTSCTGKNTVDVM